MNFQQYAAAFFSEPANIAALIVLLGLSLGALFAARRASSAKLKLFFIFAHVVFLISPTAFFAYRVGCEIPVYDCGEKAFIYAIPAILFLAVAGAAVLLFFFMPKLFLRFSGMKQLKDTVIEGIVQAKARSAGIPEVRTVVIDAARPVAFSLSTMSPAVFISVGMSELLTAKELEAVILHELGHVKSGSSLAKLSWAFGSFFSPFGRLNSWNTGADEERADRFAATAQRTWKHLAGARRKLDDYNLQLDR